MTGRGAGLTSEGLMRKINAIKKAIALNEPDPEDAIDVLAKVGGLDIAGMAGVFLGGAALWYSGSHGRIYFLCFCADRHAYLPGCEGLYSCIPCIKRACCTSDPGELWGKKQSFMRTCVWAREPEQ